MSCHGITSQLLSEYVDRDATPEERARVEEHLRICPSCQVRVRTMTATIVMTSRLEVDGVQRDLIVRLRKRIFRIDRG